jgi:hypothetical protein
MHRTFLGHLETGRKDFRLTTIIRVADGLGVTLQELFAGLEADEGTELEKLKRPRRADLDRLIKEVASLDRTVQRLKEITSTGRRRVPPRKRQVRGKDSKGSNRAPPRQKK